MGNKNELTGKIKHIALKYSTLAKITSADALPTETSKLYENLISTASAEHLYLNRTLHKRADIKKFYPPAKSVLICVFNYWNSKLGSEILKLNGRQVSKLLALRREKPLSEYENNQNNIYKIARFTASNVYQKEIKSLLEKMLVEFKKINPHIEGKYFADTSPVMEKPLAVRAGLGFGGKNTLIINPRIGSFFFIGGIALNTKLQTDDAGSFKGCGNCTLCIKSCPTKALSNYKLDIGRCITAWRHTETKKIPAFVAKHRKTLALACDICQEVCPYNKNTDTPIVKELKPIIYKLT